MGAGEDIDSPVMLVLGDSVAWGQGLPEGNKFATLVCDQLKSRPEYAGMKLVIRARSGAVIGASLTARSPRFVPSEIPWTYPTVIQQCEGYDGDPDKVRIVLLDGGINDVSVDVIIDPRTTSARLEQLIDDYCRRDMAILLDKVCGKFSNPACRVIVTGYYQIVSRASGYAPTLKFLELWGISQAAQILAAGGFSDLVALCELFHRRSDEALKAAVDEANARWSNRIVFVPSGFTAENAMFQENTLLWGFRGTPPFVDAADELRQFRAELCSNFYDDGSVRCTTCRFASIGHPTALGAIRYYERIMASLP